MKKIILTLVFLFVAQFNYASENDSLLLIQAREASLNKDYNGLRQKYISNLKDIDAFLENDAYLVKK